MRPLEAALSIAHGHREMLRPCLPRQCSVRCGGRLPRQIECGVIDRHMDDTARMPAPPLRTRVVSILSSFVAPEALAEADASTPLLGHFPELDSMALMELVAALEERFEIEIPDTDLHEANFRTLGDRKSVV